MVEEDSEESEDEDGEDEDEQSPDNVERILDARDGPPEGEQFHVKFRGRVSCHLHPGAHFCCGPCPIWAGGWHRACKGKAPPCAACCSCM